jgi:hypothetical protein
MQIAKSLKGLLWAAPAGAGAGDPPPDASASADAGEDDATADEPAAGAAPAQRRTTTPRAIPAPAPPQPPDAALPEIDFAAVYAQTGTAGDPAVDQMLTAFEAMKPAMPAPQLAIALGATAKALHADPAAIVTTLGHRLAALDTTVSDEQRKADDREAARNAELETLTQKVHAEIDAMEHKCAAFRQQLAAATERVHQKTAGERGVIAAFDAKARGEADRLKALRDFLAPAAAPRPTPQPAK